jgi:hypothetical protein
MIRTEERERRLQELIQREESRRAHDRWRAERSARWRQAWRYRCVMRAVVCLRNGKEHWFISQVRAAAVMRRLGYKARAHHVGDACRHGLYFYGYYWRFADADYVLRRSKTGRRSGVLWGGAWYPDARALGRAAGVHYNTARAALCAQRELRGMVARYESQAEALRRITRRARRNGPDLDLDHRYRPRFRQAAARAPAVPAVLHGARA